MLDGKSSNSVENTFNNNWSSEVEKYEEQYDDVEYIAFSEPLDMDPAQGEDVIREDCWYFSMDVGQELEFERQNQEGHTTKAKKYNPFYVPSKVVREMVSKAGVEWQSIAKPN
ncbi:Nrs1p DI49_3581 [Saccharomyces eubayanus]|uniref:Nrs1p n=1 Tax=Saccharomyces eubayanus TaxID=1080349 RepID=UPI0006C38F48|nr:hypothetical protein DI49_3581 [Saccharomyces eubayanus]KOG97766.1 hypothetical protein DI49_3581 [Saccharomyces eubayanus]